MALPQTPAWSDEDILAFLILCNGACLHWQVPDREAFENAKGRSLIYFHEHTDCYVHPNAVEIELEDSTAGAYEMPAGHSPSQQHLALVIAPAYTVQP